MTKKKSKKTFREEWTVLSERTEKTRGTEMNAESIDYGKENTERI